MIIIWRQVNTFIKHPQSNVLQSQLISFECLSHLLRVSQVTIFSNEHFQNALSGTLLQTCHLEFPHKSYFWIIQHRICTHHTFNFFNPKYPRTMFSGIYCIVISRCVVWVKGTATNKLIVKKVYFTQWWK